MLPVKRLSLTDFKATIPRGAREKTLKKALETEEIMKKWSETAWAKKLAAKKTRSEMDDFARFKLMVAKKKRSKAIKTILKKDKKKTRSEMSDFDRFKLMVAKKKRSKAIK